MFGSDVFWFGRWRGSGCRFDRRAHRWFLGNRRSVECLELVVIVFSVDNVFVLRVPRTALTFLFFVVGTIVVTSDVMICLL